MPLTKEEIAQRIARELKDGYYVNLGYWHTNAGSKLYPFGNKELFCKVKMDYWASVRFRRRVGKILT